MRISIVLLALLLAGCVTKTTVLTPNGSEYIIKSKSNSLVELQKKEYTIKVDNRGRPGFIEQVMGALLINSDIVKEAE